MTAETMKGLGACAMNDTQIMEALTKGEIGITPISDHHKQVQPCSVDLRIDRFFQRFDGNPGSVHLGQGMSERMRHEHVPERGSFRLQPGEFALGVTKERIKLPPDILARIEGRSSVGRSGLLVHVTAGFIDPGWVGPITLELVNLLSVPIEIPVGFLICQISFTRLAFDCERPYGYARGSKYVGPDAESVQAAKGERPL